MSIVQNYQSWLQQLLNNSRIPSSNLAICPTDKGVYAVWFEHSGKCCLLKVGMAGPRRGTGLGGRIYLHFNSNYRNSVMARHMCADHQFGRKYGFNFLNQQSRQAFLSSYCFFKVLPLPGLTKQRIKNFERWLERNLNPRYRGRVGGPYPPTIFGVCPP